MREEIVEQNKKTMDYLIRGLKKENVVHKNWGDRSMYSYSISNKNGKGGYITFHLDEIMYPENTPYIRIEIRDNSYSYLDSVIEYINWNRNDKTEIITDKKEILNLLKEYVSKFVSSSKHYIRDFTDEDVKEYLNNLDLSKVKEELKKAELDFDINTSLFKRIKKDNGEERINFELTLGGLKNKKYCGILFDYALKDITVYLKGSLYPKERDNGLICSIVCDCYYEHTGGGRNGCGIFTMRTDDSGENWAYKGGD